MPRTMEERIAAAKKYNLHPADYKPFEGEKIEGVLTGFGDYPDLPAISYDARDPYEAWDMPEVRFLDIRTHFVMMRWPFFV